MVDVSGLPVGRAATAIARKLIGKDKPTYTPHIDGGDFVVVTNASLLTLSGRKAAEFKYRYSGYPGGLKSTPKGQLLSEAPERLLTAAVKGMLPKNKLMAVRLKRLKVYPLAEHEQAAQKPITLEVNQDG